MVLCVVCAMSALVCSTRNTAHTHIHTIDHSAHQLQITFIFIDCRQIWAPIYIQYDVYCVYCTCTRYHTHTHTLTSLNVLHADVASVLWCNTIFMFLPTMYFYSGTMSAFLTKYGRNIVVMNYEILCGPKRDNRMWWWNRMTFLRSVAQRANV